MTNVFLLQLFVESEIKHNTYYIVCHELYSYLLYAINLSLSYFEGVSGFKDRRDYFPELFRQITPYLPELFKG